MATFRMVNRILFEDRAGGRSVDGDGRCIYNDVPDDDAPCGVFTYTADPTKHLRHSYPMNSLLNGMLADPVEPPTSSGGGSGSGFNEGFN